MCPEAQSREPSTFCTAAHEPVATDIDEDHGVCPDEDKHPHTPGQTRASTWSIRLGVTRTSGAGNNWYRRQRQGQT